MAIMRRANAIQHVDESEVERYLSLGFNHIDENGNIIKASMPQDLPSMRLAFMQLQAKYEESQKQVEDLKHQLEELKAKKTKKSAKAE